MIKLLKGFTIFEIISCIVCAITNFILGDIINGIILITNAVFIAIIFVPIIIAYNRSLSNEEKIAKLKNNQVELTNKVNILEKKFELLKNKLSANNENDLNTDNQMKPKECPFCGSVVSDDDDKCWYCDFDLKNGSL